MPNSQNTMPTSPDRLFSIAVLIPCYNEEATINTVVAEFHALLPLAHIYVYDNNSQDKTLHRANGSVATVRQEPLQGKGNVVRRMFADIEADIYVLVDGDSTYDTSAAEQMINCLIDKKLDMVSGARITDIKEAYRPGHRLGNWIFSSIIRWIFGSRLNDILSGYRVFSRRYVKSFPSLAEGFEIETELTVHALQLRMPIQEIETCYKNRPEGSESKLSTFKDGFIILNTILVLVKNEKPLLFFTLFFLFFSLSSITLMIPIIKEFIATGFVRRFPTAILSMSMMVIAFLSMSCGLILDTVSRGRKESKLLRYLSIPAVGDFNKKTKKIKSPQ